MDVSISLGKGRNMSITSVRKVLISTIASIVAVAGLSLPISSAQAEEDEPVLGVPVGTVPVIDLALSESSISFILPDECSDQFSATPESITVMARVHDEDSVLLPDTTVSFSVDHGLSLSESSATTDTSGLASVEVSATRETQSGSATVTAVVEYADGQVEQTIQIDLVRVVPDRVDMVPPYMFYVAPSGSDPVLADGVASWAATVELRGRCGELVEEPTEVTFSVTGSAQLSAQSVLSENGVASVTVTDTVAETVTLTTRLGSSLIGGREISFVPPPPVDVCPPDEICYLVPPNVSARFQVTTDHQIANEGKDVITFSARDDYGNPVSRQWAYFSIVQPSTARLSASSCVTDANGVCTVTVSNSQAGDVNITVRPGSVRESQETLTVYFDWRAIPDEPGLWVVDNTFTDSGLQRETITVVLKDGDLAISPLKSSMLRASSDGNIIFSGWTINNDGTATVIAYIPYIGTYTIRITAVDSQGNELGHNAIYMDVTTGLPGKSSFFLSSVLLKFSEVTATSCAQITTDEAVAGKAIVKDQWGNPVEGATVRFSSDSDSVALSTDTAVTDADGVATVTIEASGAVSHRYLETLKISATLVTENGDVSLPGSPGYLLVQRTTYYPRTDCPGTMQPFRYTATAPVTTQVAGGTASVVRFSAVDARYTPVPGVRADFTVTGSAQLSATSCVTDSTGRCEISVSDTVGEQVEVRTFVDGTELSRSSSPVYLRFLAPLPNQARLSVSRSSTDLWDSVLLTMSVRDGYGRAISGQEVSFTIDGIGLALDQNTCTTGNLGICWVKALANQAGEYVIHGLVDGTEVTGSPVTVTVRQVVNSTALLLPAKSGAVKANGTDAWVTTIWLLDAFGNPMTGLANNFVIGVSSPVQASAVTELGNGQYQVSFSSTQAGIFTLGVSLDINGALYKVRLIGGDTLPLRFVSYSPPPVVVPAPNYEVSQ